MQFLLLSLCFQSESRSVCIYEPNPRTPTLWTLWKVSTRIRLIMRRRLIRTCTFRLLWIFCFENHYYIPLSLSLSITLRRNMSARIILRGLRMLIRIDTLHRVLIVGFLVERLIYDLIFIYIKFVSHFSLIVQRTRERFPNLPKSMYELNVIMSFPLKTNLQQTTL